MAFFFFLRPRSLKIRNSKNSPPPAPATIGTGNPPGTTGVVAVGTAVVGVIVAGTVATSMVSPRVVSMPAAAPMTREMAASSTAGPLPVSSNGTTTAIDNFLIVPGAPTVLVTVRPPAYCVVEPFFEYVPVDAPLAPGSGPPSTPTVPPAAVPPLPVHVSSSAWTAVGTCLVGSTVSVSIVDSA